MSGMFGGFQGHSIRISFQRDNDDSSFHDATSYRFPPPGHGFFGARKEETFPRTHDCFRLPPGEECKKGLHQTIKLIIQAVMHLLLPPYLQEATFKAITVMSNSHYLPGSATLQRARFRIEVAWCLIWQSRWLEYVTKLGVSFFCGVDASPHCGRNYETMILRYILHTDAMELHFLISMLESMSYLFVF